jgi:hypothetical protein
MMSGSTGGRPVQGWTQCGRGLFVGSVWTLRGLGLDLGWTGCGLGLVDPSMRGALRFGVTVLTDACIRWVRERLRYASPWPLDRARR